ncbi:MAG: TetR/AcrR family transcriptional regulator [Chitinophagales bacterium]|nr:TetR/AcrR family transcriptional regulator [Chitinophagales bacterium]
MEETKISDKRDYILDVAERLFAEQGFEAISVREISKAADINIAMVSYYFGSKEKLYEDVINRKLISSDTIAKSVGQHTSSMDKLFAMVDLYIEKFFERRLFQNIIFREMAMNQRTAMAEKIAAQVHKNFLLAYDIIQTGIDNKEFKKVDIELTVMSIIGIVRMYTTSGTMACKILKVEDESEAFGKKQKDRLRKHLRQLLINHLGIESK